MTLILFLFAPMNDLVNVLLFIVAVYLFRKPERNRAGKAVMVVVAFVTTANMWLPAERIAVKARARDCRIYARRRQPACDRLQAPDSAVQIIPFDEVESRTICRLNPDLESASLVRYLFSSASERTPPC
jgi:hypothetical protein